MNLKILILTVFLFLNPVTALESSQSAVPLEYYIYSIDDLKTIESNSNFTASFYLMNDIEITDEIWKPIGTSERPFQGTFYGNNHTITFTKKTELLQPVGKENEGCGLFGNVYAGRIYDLNLVLQGNLSSNANNTGALIGVMNGNYSSVNHTASAVVNCTVSATDYSVSGMNNVGGMVGYLINGSINNSSSDCSVTTEGNNAGGLAGFVSNGAFIYSSAAGFINAGGKNAGGIIGSVRLGNVSESSATGSVTSNESAGGFVGYISDETVIVNCTANGSVKPAGDFGNFIGSWNEEYKPEVINCFYQEKEVDLEPAPVTKDSNIYLMVAAIAVLFIFVVGAIFYLKKSNSN